VLVGFYFLQAIRGIQHFGQSDVTKNSIMAHKP